MTRQPPCSLNDDARHVDADSVPRKRALEPDATALALQSITLRKAVALDWPAVRSLLQQQSLPLDDASEHIGNFIVAESDGHLVGCVGLELHGEVGLLRSLAVSGRAQRLGLGRRLVQAMLLQARQQPLGALYLLTTSAAAYFDDQGFRVVPRSAAPPRLAACAQLRGACPDSAQFMVRALP